MKRLSLLTLVFAALLGVSARAQIITNYGQSTYGADALYPGSPATGPWNVTWNGTTGND